MRTVDYLFEFDNGNAWEYRLTFDATSSLVPAESVEIKEWTRLTTEQCPNCPLRESDMLQCPVARNLDAVVEDSKDSISCSRAVVTIDTPERTFRKECATQEGLLALFGLVMASSGCPHLDWFRPLGRFHLPFASLEENLFRTLSLQLLKQFFNDPESDLRSCPEKIKAHYKEIETINHAFIGRIRSYCNGDADKNAIAALDVFVQLFQFQYSSNFKTLKNLFTEDGES